MPQEMALLMTTAASIGFLHTLLGPDHYLPFIVMARARNWSKVKTVWITVLCGFGHVGSSVILGVVGVVLGLSINRLESVESFRGNIAAWLFIGFGFCYFIWGIVKAIRNEPHKHLHIHKDGEKHLHPHVHSKEHGHRHTEEEKKNITPWVLFTLFVFGPCEPLIPFLMYPAAKGSIFGLILVIVIFCVATIGTMVGIVFLSTLGVNLLSLGRLERYMHALAGGMICLSGMGIVFLGL
jgi:nickel/cobalt exporter